MVNEDMSLLDDLKKPPLILSLGTRRYYPSASRFDCKVSKMVLMPSNILALVALLMMYIDHVASQSNVTTGLAPCAVSLPGLVEEHKAGLQYFR